MARGDMFLKIDGARQGAIKGEAQDAGHKDEIDVLGWTWGMEGNRIHGQGSAKTVVRDFKFTKQVDKATTGLMSALRSNEVIKKAVLTVRKSSGSKPIEYYTITMEKGRITSLVQQSGEEGGAATINEEVCITFSKVAVDYTPQGDDGKVRGGTSFDMDIFEGV